MVAGTPKPGQLSWLSPLVLLLGATHTCRTGASRMDGPASMARPGMSLAELTLDSHSGRSAREALSKAQAKASKVSQPRSVRPGSAKKKEQHASPARRPSFKREARALGRPPKHDPREGPKNPCAQFPEADMYKNGSADGICYIRMYKCSDIRSLPSMESQNTGDILWALTEACFSYGKYLHIYNVKVATPMMLTGPDEYSKCNDGPFGRFCGCGIHGTTCGRDADTHKKSANIFGKRPNTAAYYMKKFNLEASSCPCYQFALPVRAMGKPDPVKSKKLREQVDSKSLSLETEAPWQWELDSYYAAIDMKKCIDKHVWTKVTRGVAGNRAAAVKAFKAAVYDSKASGCEDVRKEVTPHPGPLQQVEVQLDSGKWEPLPESFSDELMEMLKKRRQVHETRENTFHIARGFFVLRKSSQKCRPLRLTVVPEGAKQRKVKQTGSCEKRDWALWAELAQTDEGKDLPGVKARPGAKASPGKGAGKGKGKKKR